MPALPSAASATLPVMPFEKTSTSIRWLSVPPLTSRKPAADSAAASRLRIRDDLPLVVGERRLRALP